MLVTMPTTERSEPQMEVLIEEMKPSLRHFLMVKFKLEKAWVAELAAEGYVDEAMFVPMGSTRDELIVRWG